MNATFQSSFAETMQRLLAEKDDISGVVITSGQEDLLRRWRPDVGEPGHPADAQALTEQLQTWRV